MPYITAETLSTACNEMRGTADHFLKIWLTLKQMGMSAGHPVEIDTRNSTEALQRLFAYGHPGERLYVPFAHTENLMTMAADASRGIIQTTLRRWVSSGSVVSVDPTHYLTIEETTNNTLRVQPGRVYPEGLGQGKNGFARSEEARVYIPLLAFGVWYYRQEELSEDENWTAYMKSKLREDLNLDLAEIDLIFVDGSSQLEITLQEQPLSDAEIYQTVEEAIAGGNRRVKLVEQTFEEHVTRVRSMVTPTDGRPNWTNDNPSELLGRVLQAGSRAVLLYGPPRTGKTRQVFKLLEDKDYEHIQIHEGWGYDELMVGLRPESDGGWDYAKGPLLQAIEKGKKYVVLEEINRTDFSQAIGEVFSLLEEDYRGSECAIKLRNGDDFFIPEETIIICTMNPLDRSTENVDDALFGRMDAIEFPPRVEELAEMLEERGVHEPDKWRELFAFLQGYHPIGQGYFAPLSADTHSLDFYRVRLRPVLQKHLEGYRDADLRAIDEKVDQLFG